jgi:hypothetical protein
MPRKNLSGPNQQMMYDILEMLVETGNLWDAEQAIAEWVNDHFHVEDFRVHCIGDEEFELEEVHLGWA